MDEQLLVEKYARLLQICREQGSLALAFSGGVDSTFCAYAARQALGGEVKPVFFRTPLITAAEEEQARRLAAWLELPLTVLAVDPLQAVEVAENRPTRCYTCKHLLYTELKHYAAGQGLAVCADGNNADDLAAANRPGNRAAAELAILHPLALANLSKAEIRALARQKGLPNHDLPARPCLATRFPYETRLTAEVLGQVAAGEEELRSLGLRQMRLRLHGDICRIELGQEDLARFWPQRQEAYQRLAALGFAYITLDLAGLQSGGFDQHR